MSRPVDEKEIASVVEELSRKVLRLKLELNLLIA
jgi:hypothetical protein